MPKQRGRKSAADLAVVRDSNQPRPNTAAPETLEPEAKALWRSIIQSRPANFFSPADLPLLREYCHTVAVLIPRVNKLVESEFDPKTLDSRDKLVRQGAALARSLRLCVSSRTRPDTASMRDSVQPTANVDWEKYL